MSKDPTYRRLKEKGRPDRAFVELNGRRIYLGKYGTEESKRKFFRVLAEWTANGRQLTVGQTELTIVELIARFWRHAEQYYRRSDGSPTGTAENFVQLGLPTAARPGELVVTRPCDIDTSGKIWICTPGSHKTAHHGHTRTVYLGPRAQQVVKPFLTGRAPSQFLFSPREAEEERRRVAHKQRKTPLNRGHRPGSNRAEHPRCRAGERYTSEVS